MGVPTHPILSIYNGHVSGREVGSTMDIMGIGLELDEQAATTDQVNLTARPGTYTPCTGTPPAAPPRRAPICGRRVSIDSVEGRPAPGAPFGPGPAAALKEALPGRASSW